MVLDKLVGDSIGGPHMGLPFMDISSSVGLSRRIGGSNMETIHNLEGSFLQFDTGSKKLMDISKTMMSSPRQ